MSTSTPASVAVVHVRRPACFSGAQTVSEATVVGPSMRKSLTQAMFAGERHHCIAAGAGTGLNVSRPRVSEVGLGV